MTYRFRHVMIITYGRSGSTLLIGLLNTLPGACVRGENGGALNHLYRAVRAVERSSRMAAREDDSPINPWYGASEIDANAFRKNATSAFVRNVLSPPSDARLIGFKEIRYEDANFEHRSFEDFLLFLREAFEDVCFIFNVRRTADVARSAWWVEDPFSRFSLTELDRRFRAAANRHSDISWWVNYESFVADPSSLKGLYEFLGAPFDLAAAQAVLNVEHSYEPSNESKAKSRGNRSFVRSAVWHVSRRLARRFLPERFAADVSPEVATSQSKDEGQRQPSPPQSADIPSFYPEGEQAFCAQSALNIEKP
jgi:hypothetical protein